MANVKSLEMAQEVFSHQHINVKKGFLGLSTTVTYQPTQSRISARQLEFSPIDGQKIQAVLGLTGDKLAEQVKETGRLSTVSNGNYRLDLAMSDDRKFAALQLFQFKQLGYEPVSRVFMLEGMDAESVLTLFTYCC